MQAPEGQSVPPRGGLGGSSGRHAFLVASGIFLSRLAGLIRQRVFAHYFGAGAAADAFTAAFRIPNVLQNLFGEGVLSASFIPVYARLLAEGKPREADRVAGAVLALLALVVAVLVLLGVAASPWLVDLIAPGFSGETRDLTIRLVRILFPGTGILVLSAWCLGVLNSHRKFFVSYTAPVLWNAAMITTLVAFGGNRAPFDLAMALAWGSVLGSLLQVGIQIPFVVAVAGGIRPVLGRLIEPVRTVVRNFVPVFIGRGVVQISAYVDALLATLLPTGAVAALGYAQLLYTLPVSLFGMSVSAAELPAMSGAVGRQDLVAQELRRRLHQGLRRIAYFVVPSSVAFLALGDLIAGAIYQTGRFTRDEAIWTWGILAAYAVGLLATTMGRLYASAFYALGDTRTPLRFAVIRVSLGIALGVVLALGLPGWIGIDGRWGVAGLALSASVAGWTEFRLLRAALQLRLAASVAFPGAEERPGGSPGPDAGRHGAVPGPPDRRYLAILWGAGAAGAAVAWGVRLILPPVHPIIAAAATLIPYGLVYLGITRAAGIEEAAQSIGRLRRKGR